jgi:hypothetical protein
MIGVLKVKLIIYGPWGVSHHICESDLLDLEAKCPGHQLWRRETLVSMITTAIELNPIK